MAEIWDPQANDLQDFFSIHFFKGYYKENPKGSPKSNFGVKVHVLTYPKGPGFLSKDMAHGPMTCAAR